MLRCGPVRDFDLLFPSHNSIRFNRKHLQTALQIASTMLFKKSSILAVLAFLPATAFASNRLRVSASVAFLRLMLSRQCVSSTAFSMLIGCLFLSIPRPANSLAFAIRLRSASLWSSKMETYTRH